MWTSARTAALVASVLVLGGCGSRTTIFGSRSDTGSGASTAVQTPSASSGTALSIDGRFETVVPVGFVDATRSVHIGTADVQYVALGPRRHGFTTNINVVRGRAQGQTDIDRIASAEIAAIRRAEPHARGFSPLRSLTVGGEPARVVDYINRPTGDRLLHQRQVFVAHDGWVYTITYSALPGDYPANIGALDAVTAGWRWS